MPCQPLMQLRIYKLRRSEFALCNCFIRAISAKIITFVFLITFGYPALRCCVKVAIFEWQNSFCLVLIFSFTATPLYKQCSARKYVDMHPIYFKIKTSTVIKGVQCFGCEGRVELEHTRVSYTIGERGTI